MIASPTPNSSFDYLLKWIKKFTETFTYFCLFPIKDTYEQLDEESHKTESRRV